jgi:hypothetical protein
MNRRSHLARRPVLASVVTAAALSLLAAGCGNGSSSPGVASITTATTAATSTTTSAAATSPQSGAVAFAECVRSHGVPGWPDPTSDGHFDKSKLRALGNGPRLRSATLACGHLLPPNTGDSGPTLSPQTRLADERSFASCMRSHGVTRFPDPNAQAELTIEMVQAQGIDIRSPQVLRVVQTCLPASHGGLTAAKVREALSSAGH